MAFALYNTESLEPIENLTQFAKLEAYQTSAIGSSIQERKRLETHLCTQKDLDDRFEHIEDYVEEYWEGYQCLDHP